MPTHLEILEHQESIKKNIGDCYYPRNIVKNDDEVEKGRAVPVGTIRERGGRKYIKTASGWKYYKGTSSDRGAKKNIEGHQNIETRKKIQRLESQIKDYQQSVQGAGHFASQIKELKAKIKKLKGS